MDKTCLLTLNYLHGCMNIGTDDHGWPCNRAIRELLLEKSASSDKQPTGLAAGVSCASVK
jgi:hypothetical protein